MTIPANSSSDAMSSTGERSQHWPALPFLRETSRVSTSWSSKGAGFHLEIYYKLPDGWCISACLCRKPAYYRWSSATVKVARMDNKYNHISNSNINNSNHKQLTASTGSAFRGRISYASLALAPYSKVTTASLWVGSACTEQAEPFALRSPAASKHNCLSTLPGSTHSSVSLELLINKEAGKSDHRNYFSTHLTHCNNSMGSRRLCSGFIFIISKIDAL